MKRKILAVLLSALMLALVIVPAAAMGDDSAKRVGEPTEKTEPVNNAASVRKAEEPKEDTKPGKDEDNKLVVDESVVSGDETDRVISKKLTTEAPEAPEAPKTAPAEAKTLMDRPLISEMEADEMIALFRENGIDISNDLFNLAIRIIKYVEQNPYYYGVHAFGDPFLCAWAIRVKAAVNEYFGRGSCLEEWEIRWWNEWFEYAQEHNASMRGIISTDS